MRKLMAMALLGVTACGGGSSAVQCEVSANCNLESGGLCVEYEPTGNKWCQYPDTTCTSGMRWSDFDTGDGLSGVCVEGVDAGLVDSGVTDAHADAMGLDATVDALGGDASTQPDAIPGKKIDIAYVSKLIAPTPAFSSIHVLSAALIINVGGEPIDITTMELVSTTDDLADGNVKLVPYTPEPPTNTALLHGQASGKLDSVATALIVTSGLVTETRVDTGQRYFQLSFSQFPEGDYVVNAETVVRIDGLDITIPIQVLGSSTAAGLEFLEAARVSSP